MIANQFVSADNHFGLIDYQPNDSSNTLLVFLSVVRLQFVKKSVNPLIGQISAVEFEFVKVHLSAREFTRTALVCEFFHRIANIGAYKWLPLT